MSRNLKQKLTAMGLSSALIISGAYLVAPFEGKRNTAYIDPVGIYTICFGATRDVNRGDYKTDDECLSRLAEDLVSHDKQMLRSVKVPLTDNQHAAFLSFTYNVGIKNFRGSTLLKELNSGNYTSACMELKRWVFAGGKKLDGLVKRRNKELEMCLNG